jgi:hypothetical protein
MMITEPIRVTVTGTPAWGLARPPPARVAPVGPVVPGRGWRLSWWPGSTAKSEVESDGTGPGRDRLRLLAARLRVQPGPGHWQVQVHWQVTPAFKPRFMALSASDSGGISPRVTSRRASEFKFHSRVTVTARPAGD